MFHSEPRDQPAQHRVWRLWRPRRESPDSVLSWQVDFNTQTNYNQSSCRTCNFLRISGNSEQRLEKQPHQPLVFDGRQNKEELLDILILNVLVNSYFYYFHLFFYRAQGQNLGSLACQIISLPPSYTPNLYLWRTVVSEPLFMKTCSTHVPRTHFVNSSLSSIWIPHISRADIQRLASCLFFFFHLSISFQHPQFG